MTRRTLLQAALAGAVRSPELAITIDDFYWRAIPNPFGVVANRTLLDTLEAHGLKAALFAIGSNIEDPQGRSLLGDWDQAGHMIGNHTYSHHSLHTSTAAEFKADVLRCDQLLKPYGNYGRFFRFPQLKEGDTATKRDAVRAFLTEQHMHTGHVTIDASDWFYDAELRKRLSADPAYDVSRFRTPYLNHLLERSLYYDRLARLATGRSPRHTILLHYNLINVLFLNDVLRMFTDHGWKLVSAQYAYRDPIFQSSPNIVPAGESLIWAIAKQTGRFDKELRYPGEDSTYEQSKLMSL